MKPKTKLNNKNHNLKVIEPKEPVGNEKCRALASFPLEGVGGQAKRSTPGRPAQSLGRILMALKNPVGRQAHHQAQSRPTD